MHPDATDSSGAGLSPAPAVGAPGERRPEPREDAVAPSGPGGGSWRVPAAVAALAAVFLSYLGPGCWQGAGGTGPCAALLSLVLYLGCASAAFLFGTLCSLVCRSRRAPPPDFAAAWRRLAEAACRRPGVSTGLPPPRAPRPRPGPADPWLPPPALETRWSRRGQRRGTVLGGGVAPQPPSATTVPAEPPSSFRDAALLRESARQPCTALPGRRRCTRGRSL